MVEDPKISRLHAIFDKNQNGNYQITVEGKNPILISDVALYTGQSKEITSNENIKIGIYSLVPILPEAL
ncbi:MAG TPA: FHA domain-containing protein [Pyrinomonadaceae bacterium]